MEFLRTGEPRILTAVILSGPARSRMALEVMGWAPSVVTAVLIVGDAWPVLLSALWCCSSWSD